MILQVLSTYPKYPNEPLKLSSRIGASGRRDQEWSRFEGGSNRKPGGIFHGQSGEENKKTRRPKTRMIPRTPDFDLLFL